MGFNCLKFAEHLGVDSLILTPGVLDTHLIDPRRTKGRSSFEPLSGFYPWPPILEIQHSNHYASTRKYCYKEVKNSLKCKKRLEIRILGVGLIF